MYDKYYAACVNCSCFTSLLSSLSSGVSHWTNCACNSNMLHDVRLLIIKPERVNIIREREKVFLLDIHVHYIVCGFIFCISFLPNVEQLYISTCNVIHTYMYLWHYSWWHYTCAVWQVYCAPESVEEHLSVDGIQSWSALHCQPLADCLTEPVQRYMLTWQKLNSTGACLMSKLSFMYMYM